MICFLRQKRFEPILFSIIIPAYNAELFIATTLNSVINQTYSNFEVIIVDDESTDGTYRVIESFLPDKRLFAYSIPHRGTPASVRNYALQQAKGNYVAFLDADDIWHPDKLEHTRRVISETKAKVLFSNGHVINDKGEQGGRLLSPNMKPYFKPLDPILLFTNLLPCSSVVVDRSILQANPFNEDTAYLASEDYLLWLELNAHYGIHYMPDLLISYRIYPSQTSNNYAVQLSRVDHILSRQNLVQSYSKPVVSLARSLLDVRRLFTERKRWDAIKKCIGLPLRIHRAGIKIMLEYIRYGFVQRARYRLLQR